MAPPFRYLIGESSAFDVEWYDHEVQQYPSSRLLLSMPHHYELTCSSCKPPVRRSQTPRSGWARI